MAIKKLCQVGFFSISLLFLPVISTSAAGFPSESIQINTYFKDILGGPSWLLILRDEGTGQVIPYLFDIKERENFWIAAPTTHRYRVTYSTLEFIDTPHKIRNVCGLENQIFDRKSLTLTLRGILSPDKNTFSCHVTSYPSYNPYQ